MSKKHEIAKRMGNYKMHHDGKRHHGTMGEHVGSKSGMKHPMADTKGSFRVHYKEAGPGKQGHGYTQAH